jgi:hypothetical protein
MIPFRYSSRTGKSGVGNVAQVVEHLPSKHEALHSNPSTTKKGGGVNLRN